ncbi:MAG: hypothetical protein HY689_06185 [Chloroflexi bacterium]|nr:hypothetical protein [Chloroflexota bacterium]
MEGIIRRLCQPMRIGWVRLAGEREVYSFRSRSLEGTRFEDLTPGQPVSFELRWDAAGRRCWAVQVRPLPQGGGDPPPFPS